MIPQYYLHEAKQRLANAEKTIEMMGGEEDCQPMLLGQRDMLLLEVEYYRERSRTFTTILLTVYVIGVIMYLLYINGVIHV
jgi:uncharacterized protein with GYD domain